MSTDFLAAFIKNPAQAKVLRVLVSNETLQLTVTTIAKRAEVSVALAERELHVLARLEIVKKIEPQFSKHKAKQEQVEHWMFNKEFKYALSLTAFVQETSPVEFKNVERALKSSGRISAVVLSGIFMGDPTRPADLLIAGDALNESRLEKAVKTLEPMFGREIRYAAFSTPEFRYRLTIQDRLFRDTLEFPHRILISKNGIFKKA
ncbi:MAG: Uncharacterized protein G01um10148_199 [Parcubacteria group bacterium Gr01-1014_8]|nr:MAG: Uncharacterized protein G01um10148_199 [Parcubacteria group bacterium Gr01-1014_8]